MTCLFCRNMLYDSLLSYSLSEHQGHSKNLSHRVRALPEQMQNYVTSMSRRQYPVLMEPRGQCGFGATQERRPVLLLAIKTSVHNYKKRQAIRKSWGRADWVWAQRGRGERRGAYVHRIFLLGTERSPELRDIFSEMLDTCGHVSFVFEGDDEVFVNTPAMVSLLQEQLQRPPANSSLQDFMMGHMVYGGQPNRNSDSQEFIPESFYRGWYPSYARGTGRLSSALLLRRLLQVSHRVHLFPIEQVYVGMCLIRLNLSPSHHPAFLPSNWTKEREKQPCAVHRYFQQKFPLDFVYIILPKMFTSNVCSVCMYGRVAAFTGLIKFSHSFIIATNLELNPKLCHQYPI
uniref:Hexosyltransferase n=1 Tax=Neogobius melanostomus TaxID=47308 RepID=A0A8C6SND9_9GOBI